MFNLYSLQSQHNKNPEQKQFRSIICFQKTFPCCHLTNQPHFDPAWYAEHWSIYYEYDPRLYIMLCSTVCSVFFVDMSKIFLEH